MPPWLPERRGEGKDAAECKELKGPRGEDAKKKKKKSGRRIPARERGGRADPVMKGKGQVQWCSVLRTARVPPIHMPLDKVASEKGARAVNNLSRVLEKKKIFVIHQPGGLGLVGGRGREGKRKRAPR